MYRQLAVRRARRRGVYANLRARYPLRWTSYGHVRQEVRDINRVKACEAFVSFLRTYSVCSGQPRRVLDQIYLLLANT